MTPPGFRTRSVHAGGRPDPATGARAVPIYQTSSYVFGDTDEAANLFALQTYGHIYSRISNPTVAAFEERVASLEGGIGAIGTSSGQSAEFLTLAALAGQGDHIVASAQLYGGTRTLMEVTLARFGIETTFLASPEVDDVAAAITPATKAVYVETIANPSGMIPDLAGLSRRRPRPRAPADRRLDDRHALPVPADRARRGHRVAFGHQVHRRARDVARRGDHRIRALPVGQRAVPADDRTDAGLRRVELVGQLRRVRLPHQVCGRNNSATSAPR